MMKKRKTIALAAFLTAAAVLTLAAPAFASSTTITSKINNHDSSQQTQSLKKVISGILMCGASTVISLVK